MSHHHIIKVVNKNIIPLRYIWHKDVILLQIKKRISQIISFMIKKTFFVYTPTSCLY